MGQFTTTHRVGRGSGVWTLGARIKLGEPSPSCHSARPPCRSFVDRDAQQALITRFLASVRPSVRPSTKPIDRWRGVALVRAREGTPPRTDGAYSLRLTNSSVALAIMQCNRRGRGRGTSERASGPTLRLLHLLGSLLRRIPSSSSLPLSLSLGHLCLWRREGWLAGRPAGRFDPLEENQVLASPSPSSEKRSGHGRHGDGDRLDVRMMV